METPTASLDFDVLNQSGRVVDDSRELIGTRVPGKRTIGFKQQIRNLLGQSICGRFQAGGDRRCGAAVRIPLAGRTVKEKCETGCLT